MKGDPMSYVRFALMIACSTIVMYGLMYLNTYAWEHVFFSETRAYMALVMGAAMAIVMLAFMLGMYRSRILNMTIFAGATAAFALSLWLVRSQVTVDGASYMRAMIPHHSIAIMTSERAGIEDARVRKLADEIIAAQRREIAEMRHLIADVAAGKVTNEVYQDPPAQVGTVEDALNNTLLAELDPSTLDAEEAAQAIDTLNGCRFHRAAEGDPVLWISADQTSAVTKLNGVIIRLEGEGDTLRAEGLTMTVNELGDDATWRADSALSFSLENGPSAGYRGVLRCG